MVGMGPDDLYVVKMAWSFQRRIANLKREECDTSNVAMNTEFRKDRCDRDGGVPDQRRE